MNFLIFIAALVVGYILIRYSKWIVDSTGIRFSSIEQVIGYGGSYTFWKFIGLVSIGFGFWVLFGGMKF
jgi:hypothetical protein